MPRRPKPLSNLAVWLGTSRTPLFVLDADRRIRVFNAGCQELTGWKAPDVVGEVCLYSTTPRESGPAALAGSLAPPPEVFSGQHLTLPVQVVCSTGETLTRLARFTPLLSETGSVTGVLGCLVEADRAPGPDPLSPVHRLHAELSALRGTLRTRFARNSVVAVGQAMRRVLVQVELAAQTGTSALLIGEPGTGREHLARVIHSTGPGKSQWFVPLDCRRLPAEELAGLLARLLHEVPTSRGPKAATSTGPGPGTLFLSAIEELPRDLQQRLVQHLEHSASQGPASTLRVLAASTMRLDELERSDRVRGDLLAALSPLVIELPPLRQRPADLPLLAQGFLEDLNLRQAPHRSGFDPQALAQLAAWPWPGNLDELFQVVNAAHVAASGPVVQVGDLPAVLRSTNERPNPAPRPQPDLNLDRILGEAERKLLELALRRTRNNKSRAAALLGIHRPRLLRRMEQLGVTGPNPSESEPGSEVDAAENRQGAAAKADATTDDSPEADDPIDTEELPARSDPLEELRRASEGNPLPEA